MHGPALLFCPADRPERYAKALAAADSVIIDLEDGVAPADKSAAREHLRAAELDPSRVIVRVNPATTKDFTLDLDALSDTPYHTLMLAKAEGIEPLDLLHARGYRVLALCETARGIEFASTLAQHPAVFALMWGAEDLMASMGGRSSRHDSGTYRDAARYARSRVLISANAYGKEAIDSVYLDINDRDGLREEAIDAAAVGFKATACIHPTQAEIIRSAYKPGQDAIAWAERVLVAAESELGVFSFEGQMIDEPVLRQARTILER